ncbi:unnamed protein product [Diamesa hyperborea]
MDAIKIVLSCVLLFAIVNAVPIDKNTVFITKLTMAQFNQTVEHGQNVWMIQVGFEEPSENFTKSAFIFRGVVKAGIIEDCSGHNMCEKFNKMENGKLVEVIRGGRVVFIHSGVVDDKYIYGEIINTTVSKVNYYINETLEFQQEEHLQHFDSNKVKIVEFKSQQN